MSTDAELKNYIELKLGLLGYRFNDIAGQSDLIRIVQPLLKSHEERGRLLSGYLSPVDQRIQSYLDRLFSSLGSDEASLPRLPSRTVVLDQAGMARVLSLPRDKNVFLSDIISSHRIKQGVLHNPRNDRRTTQGVFHVCEGGYPIPDDKLAVPLLTFQRLISAAFVPPNSLLTIPYTAPQLDPAEFFVSLLIRPVVCPPVDGFISKKSMEIRFFAPGNLVSNLDFIEMIFGNGGDPGLPENDAALDPEHWTGHTGCVILAPHLTQLKKKDLGLPAYDQATERQRRDGMCWKLADELYNDGQAFKITSRSAEGVIVTVIADNYFGYCKKEVKTQIGFSANLFGLCEEEHSGGALAFASYDLGEEFVLDATMAHSENTFVDTLKILEGKARAKPEGYAVDQEYPDIIYVPEDAKFNLADQSVRWVFGKKERFIRLKMNHTYVLPSGYKVFMKKQTGGPAWHLIGTVSEGVLCHKPCTVSGGGKSEISKSIVDSMIQGPVFTANFHKDIEVVADLLKRDYSHRFKHRSEAKPRTSRPVLSSQRSLGSVIKLFTVSEDYTDEFNEWLRSIPDYIKEILLTVKRFYRPEWGEDWQKYFSADIVNGQVGHELKFDNRKLVANYLRIGREHDGSWRTFRVRADFAAAEKIQFADDITASVVVPRALAGILNPQYSHSSVKLIYNCERYLFQRPDDAIYRGYDRQTEIDLSEPGNFLSNFEPLSYNKALDIVEESVNFDLFTEPMKNLLATFVKEGDQDAFVACSANPRIVDGKPSKNPRYLQRRPDWSHPRKSYLAEVGIRLRRRIHSAQPVNYPVSAVLPGRRSNPADKKNHVPPLAVYGPIHFQELPELFIDFICSLTGKSPSTTGFGSEGALTKGPFNALLPIIDLNNALVSFIVTGYQGFSSAAGHIGPKYRVDHDISLLMPEIWSRMRANEQDAHHLIRGGFLDKMHDFDYQGKKICASLLGYRINRRFVNEFLGRIFSNPNIVFTEDMLAPEKQDMDAFAEGMENIGITMKRVACHYFNDKSVEKACPPLKALLHIMYDGSYQGMTLSSPEFRKLFSKEDTLASAWYIERLKLYQVREIARWEKSVAQLAAFLQKPIYRDAAEELGIRERLAQSQAELKRVQSADFLTSLSGTIGVDPATIG